MDQYSVYTTPFSRYMSKEISNIFSVKNRIQTWRKLWLYLAKAQMELGIKSISTNQISEMEENISNINFKRIEEIEIETQHDVMANIRAFGEVCPSALPIIHLGATSCFVTDNADLILMKESLEIVQRKIVILIKILSDLALKYKNMPTLGYTHLQPAQPITVGKRFSIWLQDMVEDYKNLMFFSNNLVFRGAKGTVGSQDSYLELFDQDINKVLELDLMINKMAGFNGKVCLTSQTYSRKVDLNCIGMLSSIGASIHKICMDIRFLSSLGEMSEKFGENQVGSSAMPYKKNPIKSERCCGLARHLSALYNDAFQTASVQLMERTLDDSSNRRIVIPEAFITTDIILSTLSSILIDIQVNNVVIDSNLQTHLPFLASEKILIEMVKQGASRDVCHEKLRLLAERAIRRVKLEGLNNNFKELILESPFFSPIHTEIDKYFDKTRFIGLCPLQVENYVENEVKKILSSYPHLNDSSVEKPLV